MQGKRHAKMDFVVVQAMKRKLAVAYLRDSSSLLRVGGLPSNTYLQCVSSVATIAGGISKLERC